MKSFAYKLGIKTDNRTDSEIIKDIYSTSNESYLGKILFIFDNIETLESMKTLLPVNFQSLSHKHHIIITTRKKINWPNSYVVNTLPPLYDTDDAINYINKIISSDSTMTETKEDRVQLVTLCQHVPITLSFAIAYINENKISINN